MSLMNPQPPLNVGIDSVNTLADETPNEQRGIIYGFSAGISFSIGSLAGIIGGYIGEVLSINYIFPSLAVFLLPAVFLAIVLKKIL